METKGYVHVYTGNGKGKTTAAMGLALRATGAGKRIFMGQFLKGKHYSELDSIAECLPNVTLRQFGSGCILYRDPDETDRDLARAGLRTIESIISGNDYDIIILDEANIAVSLNLFTVEELLEVLEKRNPQTEIIVTGRYAMPQLIDYADLVTEMQEVKHYFQKGIQARVGIEK